MNVKTDAFSMNSSDSAGSFSLFSAVDRLAGEGRHEQIRGLFHDEKCAAEIRQDRSIFRHALEASIHTLATDNSPTSHARDLADLIRLEADLVDDTRRHVADHLRKLFSKQEISLEDVRLLTAEMDDLPDPDFDTASVILVALIVASNPGQDSQKAMLAIWFARTAVRQERGEHPSRFIMDFVIQHFDLLGSQIVGWLTSGSIFQGLLVTRLAEEGRSDDAVSFAAEFQSGRFYSPSVVERLLKAGYLDLAWKFVATLPTTSKLEREHVENLRQTIADFDEEEAREEALRCARESEAWRRTNRPVSISVLEPVPVCDLLLGDNNILAAIAAWAEPGPDLGKELKQQLADMVKKCLAKALANPSDVSLGKDLAACADILGKLVPEIVPAFLPFYFVAQEISGLGLLSENILSENGISTVHIPDARNVAHILTHGPLDALHETGNDVEEAFTSRVRAYIYAAEITDSALNDRKKGGEWLGRATSEILEFIPEWQQQDSTYDVRECLEHTVALAIEMMPETSSCGRALAEVCCEHELNATKASVARRLLTGDIVDLAQDVSDSVESARYSLNFACEMRHPPEILIRAIAAHGNLRKFHSALIAELLTKI